MRPTIEPLLLAQLVDQVPSRVRKRLDSDPAIANSWQWNETAQGWTVQANEETVQLHGAAGVLSNLSDIACSCLMSPKCFHILAVCSCLGLQSSLSANTATEEPAPDVQTATNEPAPNVQPALVQPMVEVTATMREAALAASESISALLGVGARHAGLLVQSTLLRAAHGCRASDLYALANTMLRIAEGVQRFRQQSDQADSFALREDTASALMACHWLLNHASVPAWVVGQARRAFHAIDARKMVGILAEPILTRSGFAGVTVYLFESSKDRLYTVSELRTGEANLIHQAYRGGIDLGGLTLDAKALCRSNLSVQELTASDDGRLGKGKSTRWATATREAHQLFTSGQFAASIDQQLEQSLGWSKQPDQQRPPGWDLVAFNATILGTYDASVVVTIDGRDRPWRLCVALDSPELEYRHNLEILCRCTKLRIRCLARIRLHEPTCVDLLAIANIMDPSMDPATDNPRLELPDDWQGLCNLGLDRLERHYVRGIERWPNETVFDGQDHRSNVHAKYTTALERRLLGILLGGRDAIPVPGSKTHRRDHAQLEKLFLPNAATLLNQLAVHVHADAVRGIYNTRTKSQSRIESATAFLACDAYVRTVHRSLAQTQWLGK